MARLISLILLLLVVVTPFSLGAADNPVHRPPLPVDKEANKLEAEGELNRVKRSLNDDTGGAFDDDGNPVDENRLKLCENVQSMSRDLWNSLCKNLMARPVYERTSLN